MCRPALLVLIKIMAIILKSTYGLTVTKGYEDSATVLKKQYRNEHVMKQINCDSSDSINHKKEDVLKLKLCFE